MSNATLLLQVEDNEAKRYLKTRILTEAGFEVIEATSCEDARALALARRPDLVLIDIRLPDGDGRALGAWMKATEATGQPLVLQTSASLTASGDRVAALDAGADGYLIEPNEPEELVATVRALLRLRRAEEDRRTAQAALRDADLRKEEFLAMLAHELRNPLAPILNAVEILRNDEPRLRDKARAIIGRQVAHLARMVDDLLDVSRINQRKLMLRRDNTTLKAVLDAAIETARPTMEAARHDFQVTLPPDEVWLDVDAVRISQAIANLLQNAAKFTPPGGRIRLEASLHPTGLHVAVTDNGIGLSDSILPHLFEVFAQGERSLDRSQGGLGIGLSLVRGMVEMHGGRVDARSEGRNRGSVFTIVLPLAGNLAPAPRARPGGTASSPDACRVLIVEDNVDAAETVSMLLESSGHVVRVAMDGAMALDTLRAFRPHVVLLDIGLPGMDGYEVARRLRLTDEGRDAYLIALSGYAQDRDRNDAVDAGFDLHLTKPVEPTHLEEVISSARGAIASLPPKPAAAPVA